MVVVCSHISRNKSLPCVKGGGTTCCDGGIVQNCNVQYTIDVGTGVPDGPPLCVQISSNARKGYSKKIATTLQSRISSLCDFIHERGYFIHERGYFNHDGGFHPSQTDLIVQIITQNSFFAKWLKHKMSKDDVCHRRDRRPRRSAPLRSKPIVATACKFHKTFGRLSTKLQKVRACTEPFCPHGGCWGMWLPSYV